ncbi:MAG: trypsin-like peptidase domain-containing protein [Clostridia bacterium]|nr:trypsin-like peptidase domain-containing protein [Clostridia bacterium]
MKEFDAMNHPEEEKTSLWEGQEADVVIEAEVQPEKTEDAPLTIDLSGGTASQPNFVPGVVKEKVYTEHVEHKKKGKKGRRYVAAMVALTVLNLALFGGAYMLGRNDGMEARKVSSKQELVNTLNGANADGTPLTETANTEGELATTEIAKQVGPAVVGITGIVESYSIFGGTSQSQAQGSGIILSSDGYIVTNNHVVENTSSISVILNTGTEYEAKIIGADSQTDLAVIKIEPQEELTVAKLGDSNKLEVGERVVAIGNPMGVEFFGSVTQGIVSAVNRTISIENRTMNLIQTDAAINSGNSGGALINIYGEVIGINSVKVTSTGVEGMGFAIPISEANPIIADLLQYGYVKGRPVIGISTRDVNEYMARSYSWPVGVQVMEVTSQAAANAGLQQGDIITAVNGEKVENGEALNKIKDQHKPGDVLKLDVYKYSTGRTETVEVTLSEQLPG